MSDVKKRTSSTRKYFCPGCGMSIRATRDVRIKCADCDLLMKIARKYKWELEDEK